MDVTERLAKLEAQVNEIKRDLDKLINTSYGKDNIYERLSKIETELDFIKQEIKSVKRTQQMLLGLFVSTLGTMVSIIALLVH